MKKLKKAFTLTELVIVIAVIAILAAVLIPTYTSLVRKANISADIQLAGTLNTKISEAGNITDMEELLEVLDASGYGLEKFNPTTEGYRFVWDETTNQIILLDEQFNVVKNAKDYSESTWELWLTVKNPSEVVTTTRMNFNYYLATNYTGNFLVTTLSDFDTGSQTLTGNLSIDTLVSGTANISGTINGTLTIDAVNANIIHNGMVKDVVVENVNSSSYQEFGYVSNSLQIQAGNAIVKSGAIVNTFNNLSAIVSQNQGVILNYTQPAATTTSKITNTGLISEVDDAVNASVVIAQNVDTYTYNIGTLSALLDFRDLVNSGATFDGITVKLTSDINVTTITDWTPIGSGTNVNGTQNYFAGTFDGTNGLGVYAIQNLKMTSATYDKGFAYSSDGLSNPQYQRYSYGFFGAVIGGTLQNFEIQNANINITAENVTNRYTYIGIVAGYLQADFDATAKKQIADTGVISNVSVDDDSQIISVGRLAGIVGWMDSGVIEQCENNANITATFFEVAGYGNAAGIVSWVRGANANIVATNNVEVVRICFIDDCTNNGAITSNDTYIGGIISACASGTTNALLSLTVLDCTNTGNLTYNGTTAPAAAGFVTGQLSGVSDTTLSRVYGFTNTGTANFSTAGSSKVDANTTNAGLSEENSNSTEFNTVSNLIETNFLLNADTENIFRVLQ